MEQADNCEFHRERMEKEGEELAKELENDLHTKAGLQFAGYDFEGDKEWIGTDEQWAKFEELDNQENND